MDEWPERRDLDERVELGADRAGAGGPEEVRIDEFVDARIHERSAQEGAKWQQREQCPVKPCRRILLPAFPAVFEGRRVAQVSLTVSDRSFALRAQLVAA